MIITVARKDGNGSIDFIEAKNGAKKLKAVGLTTAVNVFWEIADVDGDKKLTPGDISHATSPCPGLTNLNLNR